MDQISSMNKGNPTKVFADVSYDMWCFGVLVYKLCTGFDLFMVDNQEEANDLTKIINWNEGSLEKKLENIRNERFKKTFQPLLKKLLHPEPKKRPNNWDNIIKSLNQQVTAQDILHQVDDRFDKMEEKMSSKLDHLLELASSSAPRFMFIIPSKHNIEDKFKLQALLQKKVKIVFICPVSRTIPRDDNGNIKGYEFDFPKGWYEQFGPYLRITLMYVSLALKISGVAHIPNILPDETEKLLAGEIKVMQTYMEKVEKVVDQDTVDLKEVGKTHIEDFKIAYEQVKKIALEKNDGEFLQTGLKKVICKSDTTTSEYVLNHPDIIELYESKGNNALNIDTNKLENFFIAKSGNLRKKKNGKKVERYYVLRINSFISYYKKREDYEQDRFLGLNGETKPRFTEVKNTGEKGFTLNYIDTKAQHFEASSSKERDKWCNELKKHAFQKS